MFECNAMLCCTFANENIIKCISKALHLNYRHARPALLLARLPLGTFWLVAREFVKHDCAN